MSIGVLDHFEKSTLKLRGHGVELFDIFRADGRADVKTYTVESMRCLSWGGHVSSKISPAVLENIDRRKQQ